MDISEGFEFVFRPVKVAPRNYVSQSDMVLADVGILEVGLDAEEEGFSAACIDTMSDLVYQLFGQFFQYLLLVLAGLLC